ncbi:MAG: EF-P lysine aminoacylase EpmA [Gammaproteobacteria bacterium]
MSDWRPTASWATLHQRARLLAGTRGFFADRDLLEVETPALIQHAVTDPQLQNMVVQHQSGQHLFLHTSPEFHMKRLLAAGAPDIWQLAKVFRDGEAGRRHEPEFTLVEWYRHGFSLQQMAEETCALLEQLARLIADQSNVARGAPRTAPVYWSYRQLFQTALGIDPLGATAVELENCARKVLGDQCAITTATRTSTDPGSETDDVRLWLDLLMTHVVEQRLAETFLAVISGYPASQAALARLDPVDPRVAERFEVYLCGIEVANGYRELRDPAEHRQRFAADRAARLRLGYRDTRPDVDLIAAIEQGLPDCAGVAVGFDRVLMVLLGLRDIQSAITFPVLPNKPAPRD